MASRAFRQKEWNALRRRYANLENPEWMLGKVPKGFWDDIENQKRYLAWLANQLDLKKPEDWYQVTHKMIQQNRGGGLIVKYQGSHINLICSMIPNREWQLWRFHYAPRGFWTKKVNRVQYLKWLESELGYKKPEDWYQVCDQDFRKNYGKVIAESGSFTEILRELYPKFDWMQWKFTVVEAAFWDRKENQKRYLLWLGKQLGFKKREDWYRLSKRDFYRNHGRTMIDVHFNTVPADCLKFHFPEYDWLPWLFSTSPDGYWEAKENRIKYFKWLGNQLGFKKPTDWYQLGEKEIRGNKGEGLYAYYDCKIHRAVSELYPNRKWYPWLFRQTPKGYFRVKKNRLEYFRWLLPKMRVRSVEKIESLSTIDFKEHQGGYTLVRLIAIPKLRAEMKACFLESQ